MSLLVLRARDDSDAPSPEWNNLDFGAVAATRIGATSQQRVRNALVQLCATLLLRARRALPELAPMLLDALITIVCEARIMSLF